MHFSSLLSSAAALALTVDAFLVPLEVSDEVTVDDSSLVPGAQKQTFNLECPGCPIALETDDPAPRVWKIVDGPNDQPSSKLVLDFAVEGGQVKLNDLPIFPPGPQGGLGLRAKQTTSEESIKPYQQGVPLSTSIEIQPVEAVVGKDGVMKIHPISIEILGLSDHVVHTDTVRVLAAEGANGRVCRTGVRDNTLILTCTQLMLLPIETTPYQHSPLKDTCPTVLCRVKATIAAKITAFRAAAAARFGLFRPGCMSQAGNKQGHRGPHVKGGPNKFPGHRRPHGHGAHAHHHHLRQALRRIIRHVILPIFFGITAGMVVGAFSMLIWTAVASIANRIRGSKPPAYESLAQAEDGSRMSMDGPPKYEDVYTEPEEDVTDEKRQLMS